MNRKAYLIGLFLLAAVLTFSAAACGMGKQNKDQEITETDKEGGEASGEDVSDGKEDTGADGENVDGGDPDADGVVSDDLTAAGDDAQESADNEKAGLERIGIYTIDDATLETSSLTAVVDVTDGLTPDTVVDAVVLALEDHSIEIRINSTVVEEGKAAVDIGAENPAVPFGNAGSAVESVVLDCISYSLFDNFEDIREIYFTVNGDAYESGHLYLPVGEAYLTK